MRGKISDPLAIKMNNTTLGSLEGHKHIENQDPVVPSYRVLNPAGFLVKWQLISLKLINLHLEV